MLQTVKSYIYLVYLFKPINRNAKIIGMDAISTLRKLAGREVMEIVQDLTGQKSRSSHCYTTAHKVTGSQMLCWGPGQRVRGGRVGWGVGGRVVL